GGVCASVCFTRGMEQMVGGLGGKSDWMTRVGARVLPAGVTLVDDPGAKDYNGKPVIGGYNIDEEGVPGQKVTVVENGTLKNELMSPRPRPDFGESNRRASAAF